MLSWLNTTQQTTAQIALNFERVAYAHVMGGMRKLRTPWPCSGYIYKTPLVLNRKKYWFYPFNHYALPILTALVLVPKS